MSIRKGVVLAFAVLLFAAALKWFFAPPSHDRPIVLRVAWWGARDRDDRTIRAIQLFETLHPGIKVTFEYSGWNEYYQRISTQAAGNQLPDVMQQDYEWLREWSTRGLLLPLDSFVASQYIHVSDIPDNILRTGRWQDRMYGVPLGLNSQAWVLDLDAFEKAGVALPPEDWTWEDFEETTTQLHRQLHIWGSGHGLDSYFMWQALYLGLGQPVYAEDGRALGYSDDRPLMDHMKMVLRLQDEGAIPTRKEEVTEKLWDQGIDGQEIIRAKAATACIWSSEVIALYTAAGDHRRFKLLPVPRPKGGRPANYIKPSMLFSISANSKHPKEAAMFIDFFINSMEANRILGAERGVPASTAIRNEMTSSLTEPQRLMFAFLDRVESMGVATPPPDPFGQESIIDNVYWSEFIDPVLYGKITPEAGVAALRRRATEILAENK
jgi:multiple sugar transport system substrate-binding protein